MIGSSTSVLAALFYLSAGGAALSFDVAQESWSTCVAGAAKHHAELGTSMDLAVASGFEACRQEEESMRSALLANGMKQERVNYHVAKLKDSLREVIGVLLRRKAS